MLIVEMAGGILTGLLFGFALAVIRPLLALALTVAAAAVALVLITGPPWFKSGGVPR